MTPETIFLSLQSSFPGYDFSICEVSDRVWEISFAKRGREYRSVVSLLQYPFSDTFRLAYSIHHSYNLPSHWGLALDPQISGVYHFQGQMAVTHYLPCGCNVKDEFIRFVGKIVKVLCYLNCSVLAQNVPTQIPVKPKQLTLI